MQAKLVPLSGGRPIRIEKEVTVLGRRRWVCDIYIEEKTISKFHCLIIKSIDGGFYVRDLGSANGTFINGSRITEEALMDGDEVVFANKKFRLLYSPDMADVGRDSAVILGSNDSHSDLSLKTGVIQPGHDSQTIVDVGIGNEIVFETQEIPPVEVGDEDESREEFLRSVKDRPFDELDLTKQSDSVQSDFE